MSDEITLKLNQYQAGNLRWLLRIAMSTTETEYAEKFPDCSYVRAAGLFTGDWTGEICWELEQQMIDADMEPASNLPSPWKLDGWHGGYKTSELAELHKKPPYIRLSDHASPVTPQEQNTTQENEVRKKERSPTAGQG